MMVVADGGDGDEEDNGVGNGGDEGYDDDDCW